MIMKKHILLLILLLIVCGDGIALPYYFNSQSTKKIVEEEDLKKNELSKKISEESSNKDTVIDSELSDDELEPGVYDKEQIFIKGIEALDSYFKINQLDNIRQRIQFHIKQNINSGLKEGNIEKDSIKVDNNNVIFKVKAGKASFNVRVSIDKPAEINIIESVKKQ